MQPTSFAQLGLRARHIVGNLQRVVPAAPADGRTPVVALFPHPDVPARLVDDAAELRRRFPADRHAVTLVLPAARVLGASAAAWQQTLGDFRLLEVQDAAFVAQMRALAGAPFAVDLDGRLFVHVWRQRFLSRPMAALWAEEDGIDHGHAGDLRVLMVPGGVVHPLEARSAAAAAGSAGQRHGGVTDAALNFVPISATERTNARCLTGPATVWYDGANPDRRQEPVLRIDEDVVFLGAMSAHYGHFLLESLARLWFFLSAEHCARYKAAYIADPGVDHFLDVLGFFGLPRERLIRVTRPTAFRSVTVPEQSMRLQDRCHPLYKQTIDRIQAAVPAAGHRKVYFSKEKRNNFRGIGERPMEEVFVRNGYQLFYPEQLSMAQTIAVLKGCESFAASSGTNAHNALFLPDGARCITLNRSPHVHYVQTMIERMKGLDAVYVEANVSLLPVDWSAGPFLFGPTRHLFDFFHHAGMQHDAQAMRAAFPAHLAEFLKTWGLLYSDPRRQAYLEPQEQARPLADLIDTVADTFLREPVHAGPAAWPAAA